MSLKTSPIDNHSLNERLLQSNIEALQEGLELLLLLKPGQYVSGYKPAFNSTIGAHFRHVLEHYRCFITQLSSGEISYDKRLRDQQLEVDCDYANQVINDLISNLKALRSTDLNSTCVIRDQQAICDQLEPVPVNSTVYRELLFLQSHTVHHYAIIGAMTRAFGANPAEDFGVAIATREHQKNCDENDLSVVAVSEVRK